MKKKANNGYSLTARERKELRRKEAANDSTAVVADEAGEETAPNAETDTQTTNTENSAARVLTKTNIWIMSVSIVLGLLIILTAIILPFVLPQEDSKYPRAVITLDDGRQLTMTIWEEECPIAATNFIFLAQIGFFDGVIVHDVQPYRNYMRFGAYKSYASGDTRYEDADFISSIPKSKFNIVNLEKESDRVKAESAKFGYRLRKDSSKDAGMYGNPYVVSFNYSNAADFVINLGENNANFTDQKGQNNLKDNLVAFGQFEDEKSRTILDELYAREKNENTGSSSNFVGTVPIIKIKSVKVSNLNKKKWKKFEFISYMNTAYDGSTAIRTWVG